MKKQLITFLIITLLMIGCKKESNNTSKIGGSTTQSTTAASTETYITGHWTFDSLVVYQSNTPSVVQVGSAANLNNYIYDAYCTAYSGGGGSNLKSLSYGRAGQNQNATSWYVSDVYLNATGLLYLESIAPYFSGYIISASNNKLVVAANYGSTKNGNYFYLHK